ncbi:MAG: hypothetical protein ACRDYF_13910 [Acidimicrobiia bacterium]
MVAGPPRSFPVPPAVVQLAGGGPCRAVWENELGGLTFAIGEAAQRQFVKWAPRCADLAIATWSTNWNYGPGWEPVLLEAYGVEADPERTAYYRLLWELGP